MTKHRLAALLLLFGALASPGCGGDGAQQPDNGVGDPDVGVVDLGVEVDAGGLANGAVCTTGRDCASGECVDGVCCDTGCDGVCVSCTAALTGQTDGVCAPTTGNTDPDVECSETECMPGLCDGAGACARIPDGTPCRASAGDCDVAETCAAGACPADLVQSEGVVCRSAAGVCDAAEACDGATSACPVDEVADSTASVPACEPYVCPGVGIACGTTCETDADCSFGNFCVQGVSNTCVPGRLIFVTSTVHSGNLGGLAGADAICQARATEAGLTGTFRAWLSSGTTSASDRIHHYAGPYYRFALPGTLRVASSWADLVNGLDSAAIATDENGVSAGSGAFAWTGTQGWGATDTANTRCLDWTSSSASESATRGWTSAGSYDWSSNGAAACNSALHLYCVETVPPS